MSNIRRSGEVVRRRKGETINRVELGPTPERLLRSGGNFTIGDDQQGTRIYHFLDAPVNRLYARLKQADKSDGEQRLLASEWTALLKYRHHWYFSGLESSPRSVDLDRVFSSDPANMSGMAKSERQSFHRQMHRKAAEVIGHKASILLDNFVCYEWDREIASGMSPYRFRKAIRETAQKLARHWGL